LLAAFEFSACSGEPGVTLLAGPDPGSRSLTAFLLGVEAINSETSRGPFALIGLGVGHVTLKGAWGFADNPLPPRNDVGFAMGADLGYRSVTGPGPLGFQTALRTHAVVKDGQAPAVSTAISIGLAY